jgi:magnesium transporter
MATYLSQIINKPVWGEQGQRLGRCMDLLVEEMEQGAPALRAMAMQQRDGQEILVPASQVSWLSPAIILSTARPAVYQPRGNELWLRRQVMDRQIVDVEGHRLVRVNDLQLTRVSGNGHYHLTGVAVGTGSLARRLGIEGLSKRVSRLLGQDLTDRVIPWQDVAPVEADAPIRLRVSRERIRQINPVDMADLISEMDHAAGVHLLERLDDETVADAMAEIEPDMQVSVLSSLPPERAADVLEEMDPDDAADLLSALEDTERSSLLELMEKEDSVLVEKLLSYPEDTAGGIMTPEFSTLPIHLRAGEAMEYLRRSEHAQDDETMYNLYIVDEEGRLRGVLSLRALVMADPQTPVAEIMEDHPVTVEPLMPQRDVARLVAKYNLLDVPVVDEQGIMQGIVTVDDAIDAIIPTAWKKRLPRFF